MLMPLGKSVPGDAPSSWLHVADTRSPEQNWWSLLPWQTFLPGAPTHGENVSVGLLFLFIRLYP